MASISVIVIVPLLVVCILLIPTLIGIYIYRDAKARHMDAVLWTLVALLVPSFIGLIIYLIIRGNASNLACPRCKKPVSAQYALCPYCGVNLKASCPRCGSPVDSAFCSKCGASVPETHGVPSAEPKKDRKLLGILIAAVLVPIALFVVGVVSIGLLWRADVSVGSMTLGTGLRGEEVPAYVNEWVAACDANGAGVYVLKPNAETAKAHMEEMGDLGLDGEDIYFVYIYMNAHKGENSGKAFYGTGEILDNLGDEDEVEIKYETTYANAPEKVPDFELSVVGIEGYGIEDLRIYIDGEITPYCVTQMP